jgi:hypothetical protein
VVFILRDSHPKSHFPREAYLVTFPATGKGFSFLYNLVYNLRFMQITFKISLSTRSVQLFSVKANRFIFHGILSAIFEKSESHSKYHFPREAYLSFFYAKRFLSLFSVEIPRSKHSLNQIYKVEFSSYLSFFKLPHNDRVYGHMAVCGSFHCRTATK